MKLPKIQDADLRGKIVLIRVDHNVVKKGRIKDPYRIDASLDTIQYVISKGGKPILMTHVGRPRNKKTGEIDISDKTSVKPIIEYLKKKTGLIFLTPDEVDFQNHEIDNLLKDLKSNEISGIYLPNVRWFEGEESGGEKTRMFGNELANLADVFVNDAFGSWQPHASTIEPTKYLPSYAGILMQKEIENLSKVLNPQRPLVAVIAGSKFDTKIGTLTSFLKMADYLVLGGVIYNAYLCAKYGFKISGITDEDLKAAQEFLKFSDTFSDKILELPFIIESDVLEEKIAEKFRIRNIIEIKPGTKLNFILDVSTKSFELKKVKDIFHDARTIFVNAVMGFTPNFYEGTFSLNSLIDQNKNANKLFGGGDTLQEFKTLLPGIYNLALKDEKYYFFTGGGTILKAVKEGTAFGLEPVKALMRERIL
ncbi:MAG: phosphoglycerate kinase [Armatimonadetes bacterium]|nr:phosphoglycerate kinase [Armatimonadota bacterium]